MRITYPWGCIAIPCVTLFKACLRHLFQCMTFFVKAAFPHFTRNVADLLVEWMSWSWSPLVWLVTTTSIIRHRRVAAMREAPIPAESWCEPPTAHQHQGSPPAFDTRVTTQRAEGDAMAIARWRPVRIDGTRSVHAGQPTHRIAGLHLSPLSKSTATKGARLVAGPASHRRGALRCVPPQHVNASSNCPHSAPSRKPCDWPMT